VAFGFTVNLRRQHTTGKSLTTPDKSSDLMVKPCSALSVVVNAQADALSGVAICTHYMRGYKQIR